MGKTEIMTSFCDLSGAGLEIGPQANGLVPKCKGYNVKIADWMSADELRKLYVSIPDVDVNRIEEVDYVTGGGRLCEAIPERQAFDYIIASHVIEHIPDLIQFLQDCEALLSPNGKLVLAVPDKRYIFDVLRPLTSLGDIMQAHLEKRTMHPAGKILDLYAYAANRGGGIIWGPQHDTPLQLMHSLAEAKQKFAEAVDCKTYIDTHGWTFVPSSFRLLMNDLFEIGEIQIKETDFVLQSPEFFIALSRSGVGSPFSRNALIQQILDEWRLVQ